MIDSHCHLNDEKYIGEVDEVVKNFKEAGVKAVVNIGVDLESSKLAKTQSEKYNEVYYSIGFQPEFVEKYNESEFESFVIDCLKESSNSTANIKFTPISATTKLVAIGEIGLDYYYTKENREKQISVFESQIKIAKKYNLPIIIHNRDASGDVLEILKRNAPFSRGGVIHCFSSSLEWAKEVIKLGFIISFAGNLTYKNSLKLHEVGKWVDMDNFLLETDAPYLAPIPHRGEINEPKNVIHTAKFLAKLKGCEYDEIVKHATKNAQKIFNIKLD